MKLFLASSNDTLPLIASRLPKNGKRAKVIFIANASDNHSGEKWWIEADRKAFEKIGCEIVDIDLRSISSADFNNALRTSDVLHFCGGSVLYLIALIKKKGLDKDIVKIVRAGKILYSGTSAGSMIASHDLRLSAYDDEDKEFAKGINDLSGLGFVNFLIIPHTNNKDFAKSNHQMIDHLADNLQTLIFIHDKQAVWVEEDRYSIIQND